MMKYVLFPLVSVFLITGPYAFGAERPAPGGFPPHPPRTMHFERFEGVFFGSTQDLKERLNLSDEQVEKISGINLEYKKKLMKIREKIQPKESRLQDLLLENTVDLMEIRSLLEAISSFHVEMGMLRITQRLDIEKVLTLEQKRQLKECRGGRGMMGMFR